MEISELGPVPSDQPSLETRAKTPQWAFLSLFFLSALFYLSGVLAVFAPLPLLFLFMKQGRKWAWFATLTNTLIVAVSHEGYSVPALMVGKGASIVLYLFFVVVMTLALSEVLVRKKSLEKSVAFSLLAILGFAAVSYLVYCQIQHLNPVHEILAQLSSFEGEVGKALAANSENMNPEDLDELKHKLIVEIPCFIGIFSLFLVFINLSLLMTINPNEIRERLGLEPGFFKKWKAPEKLIWPTIFSGLFLVVDLGVISEAGLNLFKFLMSIYVIQGLSILSYVFDLIGIKGILKLIGYFLSLFFMMPLVLSLGFFDLWFDFRGKFRQS